MNFLSYASANSTEAKAIVSGLRALGMNLWYAEGRDGISPGTAFQSELEQRLLDSSGFLLLVGRRGVDRWVRLELDVALARHVREPSYRIVPLLLPEVDPDRLPPFLARFHREQLVGDVARWGPGDFQALAQRLQLPRELTIPEGTPFPGLEALEERSTCFFFGRDHEIREALRELGMVGGRYRRWLHIEGPSGAGKSSFARAGIVPAIRLGWIEGGPSSWRVAVFRPGRHPLQRLAKALIDAFGQGDQVGRLTEVRRALEPETGLRDFIEQGLGEGEGLLLVIDQLEELLASSEEPNGESKLLQAAVACALQADNGLHLVTTLRSDFITRLPELDRLGSLLNTHAVRYYLAPMKPAAIQAVVDGPSSVAGVKWEEGLKERLLQDSGQAAESLPLMAHVLNELWKRRTGALMTHGAYETLGGVAGALSRSADALIGSLSTDEQQRARMLLTSLVKVGRGSRDVRRILTREEALRAAGGEAPGGQLIARLSGTPPPGAPPGLPAPPRLLSVSADRVDLVHEALIERWEKLRNWVAEDRRVLERMEDTEHAARGWAEAGKPEDGLPGGTFLEFYRGSDLARPEALRQRLTPLAQEFVDAASAIDRERREIAVVLKVLAVAGMLVFYGWRGLSFILGDPQELFPAFGWGWLRTSAEHVELRTTEAACESICPDWYPVTWCSNECLADIEKGKRLDYKLSYRELSEKGQAAVRLELVKPSFLPAVPFLAEGMTIAVTSYPDHAFRVVLRDRSARSVSYACVMPLGQGPLLGAVFGLSFKYDQLRYSDWINLREIESVMIEVPIRAKGVNDFRDGDLEEGQEVHHSITLKGIQLQLRGADIECRLLSPP